MFLRSVLLLAGLAWQGAGQTAHIRILVTTDLHGNIYPWDYFAAQPANRGLAKIATLIRQQRKENPETLVIDCGDTIQGSPLESVYQEYVRTGRMPLGLNVPLPALRVDPMMLAMNALGYDAMVVGNHEFNFGLKNLEAARRSAKFPWISANTLVTAASGLRPFEPYLVKTLGSVKVAVIGITTPAVPNWEKPENYRGLKFVSGVDAVRKALAELRAQYQPDVVIVAAHAGLDRDLRSGEVRPGEAGFENMVYQIATSVEGIDAIVFGHTHQVLEQAFVGSGVLLHQPKNWGMSLGRVDFQLEQVQGRWRIASKQARLLPVTREVEPDGEILSLARPYHEWTEQFLEQPVAESPEDLDGALSRVADTALVDAIHQVQLHFSKADVSLTAMFNPRVRFPKGAVTVRQLAALYIYDNELYVIEGNGKMLKAALENAARYFLSCRDPVCSEGPLLNRKVIGYNYDMAQGVDYEIDLTQPEGSRIRNLRYRGKPLEDLQPLRIALNNYRASGSGGYQMFRQARVVWKSGEDIRNLMIEYYRRQKKLPANADGNWKIVPESARKRLETEALAEARPETKD
ncbi:MAG: 5'-nucleotidase C-terminal domain-containing protein [Bryobacteraceae bacterium]|nr:5'-nucleotidase C-terminal domain-containing protein [Bryobacteraceae bacterium]MDW8380024.1 5'-nucleotidase C-terminal domain-containing protein [Bryobacterales bacterium]